MAFPVLVIRNYSELVDALRAVKNHLELSNESLEGIAGLCSGGADKYLGTSQSKGIGPVTFDLLLAALAIQLRVEPDIEQAEKMSRRWERRQQQQVRQPARISRKTIELCRPIILAELGRKGAAASAKARRRAQQAHSPRTPEQQARPAA